MPMRDAQGRVMTEEETAAFFHAEAEKIAKPARLRARSAAAVRQADNREAMSLLCEAFHILDGAPGTRPFEASELYEYAWTAAATNATRHAIRFVLMVWNTQCVEYLDEERVKEGEEPLGNFDAVRAMMSWDAGNRAAFVTWAQDPWWG